MATLGEQLRRARAAKGLSLEQVSRATKIHLNTLTAIEEDRAAQTLSPIYLKGFIKTYARHVGIDEASLLVALAPTTKSTLPPPTPTGPLPAPERSSSASTPTPLPARLPQLPWRIIGIAVAVLFVVVGLGRLRTRRPHHAATSPLMTTVATKSTTTRTASRKATTAAKTARAATASRTASAASRDEGVRLTVSVDSMTWMQVMADGVVIFQQVLPPGARETWLARKEITLWLGDAGGVSLEVNGRPLGTPGKHGEVIRGLRVTAQGIQR